MEAKTARDNPTQQEKPKRHIRNLLLDKQFQMRWVLRVVITVALIVTVMGFFLYQTVGNATDQMLAQQLADPMLTKEAFDAFVERSVYDKNITLLKIAGGLCSLVVLLGGLTIIYTHKIAGPLHRMRRLCTTIDGKSLQLFVKLRKSDDIQEAFIEFDNMLRRLREARQEDINRLEEIQTLLQRGDNQDLAVKKLDEFVTYFKDSVKVA